VEKIKTVGDSYMWAGGMKTKKATFDQKILIKAAFEMNAYIRSKCLKS